MSGRQARTSILSPRSKRAGLRDSGFGYAVKLIRTVCQLAGSATLIEDQRSDFQRTGLLTAIDRHDTPRLFDYVATAMSYQGGSDAAARTFMARHGRPTWRSIASGLGTSPVCPLLHTYWNFEGCRYEKTAHNCAHPDKIGTCPLPDQTLRNGRLNQMAFSLFLFMRDIAIGDFVAWIDSSIAKVAEAQSPTSGPALREAVVGPLRNVYGASDKVLNMTLSGLLLCAPEKRTLWLKTGAAMIAIDTLVHNFLHRTGVLKRLNTEHEYGSACSGQAGCLGVLERVANAIDAREFNADFPVIFPRFVQHAIWRFCAQDGLDICNGNRIDDRTRCRNLYCRLFDRCDRVRLGR